MYGYIYKTTNLINNKIYIGQKTSDEFVESYLGSGTLIKQSIKKNGRENFKVEMIDTAKNREELDSKEKYWIEQEKSNWKFGNYNIAEGGLTSGYHIGMETPERLAEIKKKISKSSKGRKHTEETKRKMSKTRTGMPSKLKGVPSGRKGIPLTLEHRQKLRDAHTGKKLPEEQKEKMSKWHKEYAKNNKDILTSRFDGYRENRAEKVNVYNNGELVLSFDKIKDCVKYFSERGLGQRVVVANLRKNEPICPDERPSNMGNKIWKTRQKYKDYDFVLV